MTSLPRPLRDLAEFVGGRIIGDPEMPITGVASIESARRTEITFALNEKYLQAAEEGEAACIIVPPHLTESDQKTLLTVDNPRFAFAKIAGLFAPPASVATGIHATAVIDPTTRLGRNVSIGAKVVVGREAIIGDDVVLYPGVYVGPKVSIGTGSAIHANVTVEDETAIGAHCIIHAGTVIGSDGFGFVENGGKHFKIPQTGRVVIEDNVEIGSNCAIDRAAADATIIRSGTKIDNLVHVAHNVVIGHDCLIVAQVGISGSVTIGNNVILAGQSGVAGHIEIGDRTVVAAKAGVTKSIPGGLHVSGFPAKPHLEEKRIMISLPKLPELIRKLGQLVTAVQRLARRLDKIEGGRA
jgi:UDP-3-O-[3-hydroxymyristoyl] glucosamine N-acyltransferase